MKPATGEGASLTHSLSLQQNELEAKAEPSAEEAAPEAAKDLVAAQTRLDEVAAMRESVRSEFLSQQSERLEIAKRLETLSRDLARNQDALKIRNLGGDADVTLPDDACPTCHQLVQGELLPSVSVVAMGLQENINFIKSQMDLYSASLEDADGRLADLKTRFYAVTSELDELRSEIRGLKDALVQPSNAPSRAILERQVAISAKLDQLQFLQEAVDQGVDSLRSLSMTWRELSSEMKTLGGDDLSGLDRDKLGSFQHSVQQRLSQYNFRSFPAEEVVLSKDNFRPIVCTKEYDYVVEKEVDIGISASDSIRLKWAYYFALLLLGARFQTNHPGLLIIDEPGQQEVRSDSLLAFMSELGQTKSSGGQVIVGTSAKLNDIAPAVAATGGHLIDYDGYILQPI